MSKFRQIVVYILLSSVAFAGGFITSMLTAHKPNNSNTWNMTALKTVHVRAEGFTRWDKNLENESVGTLFTVDLMNTTGSDITIPKSAEVMESTKNFGALHGSLLALDKDYFVPAGHTVSIMLDNDQLCAAKDDPKQCFDSYFAADKSISIFLMDQKDEVEIPIPTFSSPVPTSGLPMRLK